VVAGVGLVPRQRQTPERDPNGVFTYGAQGQNGRRGRRWSRSSRRLVHVVSIPPEVRQGPE
jgi:hypothetical protein